MLIDNQAPHSFKIAMKLKIILFILAISHTALSQSDSSKEIQTFSKNNFTIQYPKSWVIDTAGVSKLWGAEVFIFSPSENKKDKFSENVNIIMQDLSDQDMDLKKYKELTERQISGMSAEGKIIESVIVKSGEGEYYRFSFTMKQDNLRVRNSTHCYIKNNHAYLVTFCSEVDKYVLYKKTRDKILASFVLAE